MMPQANVLDNKECCILLRVVKLVGYRAKDIAAPYRQDN